jgi:hypothetical protein
MTASGTVETIRGVALPERTKEEAKAESSMRLVMSKAAGAAATSPHRNQIGRKRTPGE